MKTPQQTLIVMRGLDPRIHQETQELQELIEAEKMGRRVKPGDDASASVRSR
jgi:hypothetical protein